MLELQPYVDRCVEVDSGTENDGERSLSVKFAVVRYFNHLVFLRESGAGNKKRFMIFDTRTNSVQDIALKLAFEEKLNVWLAFGINGKSTFACAHEKLYSGTVGEDIFQYVDK
jgi:hypothetical protein